MKSTTFISASLVSLAGMAMAEYGLVAIRSGSMVQYLSAYAGDDGKVYLGSSDNGIAGDFSDDKFVLSKPVSGKSLSFDEDDALVISDDGASASNDGDNHLIVDGNGGGFTACSAGSGSGYAVYNSQKGCDNAIPFIFRLQPHSGDNSTSTTTSGSETSTSTESPTSTSTTTTTTTSPPEFTGGASIVKSGSIFAVAAGVVGAAALY